MGLTQAQKSMFEKARSVGNSDFAVPLDDVTCCYLISVIVHDLGLVAKFPDLKAEPPPFFGATPLDRLVLKGFDFWRLVDGLLKADGNADTYFSCLAMLHSVVSNTQRFLSDSRYQQWIRSVRVDCCSLAP